MRSVRFSGAWLVPLMFLLLGAQADQKAFVSPSAFDFDQLIGQPPADDSKVHADELAKMLAMQTTRTHEEEARCQSEVKVTPFVFSQVVGDWFNEKELPKTAALLREVTREATRIADVPKQKFNRTRPPIANPEIHACVPLERTGSFPSGHATRGIVWATIVAEIFPEEREQIMARGKQIGDDRVLAGMHYPSDVVAGQALGAAIVQKLLANPDFTAELNKAKLECHAAGLVHH